MCVGFSRIGGALWLARPAPAGCGLRIGAVACPARRAIDGSRSLPAAVQIATQPGVASRQWIMKNIY
jgi:hypothetical protein